MNTAPTPPSRNLRNFGLLLGALIVVFFGALPYGLRHHVHIWPFILAVLLWAAALASPQSLRYIHAGWTRLGLALGWVNIRIILGLFYAAAIIPVALAMRLVGRDRMQRRLNPASDSYRIPSRRRSAQSMDNPF